MGKMLGSLGAPTQYGKVDYPNAPQYINNPSSYQAFNRTPMAEQQAAQIRGGGELQGIEAQNTANMMGMGKSANNMNNQNTIAGQTENRVASNNYQAALDTFKEQLGQQQGQNQFNAGIFGNQIQGANAQNQNYYNEQALRRNTLSQLPFGGILGAFL